jgi:hypothetical protein
MLYRSRGLITSAKMNGEITKWPISSVGMYVCNNADMNKLRDVDRESGNYADL